MSSEIKADKWSPASGTSATIGDSGDTYTVPTGANFTVTDELKTNKISPASGTAFTLGDSGDTFTVPSGVTLANSGTATGFSGFVRVGGATVSSSVSSIAVDNVFSTTYDVYRIVGQLSPDTAGADSHIRFRNGGSDDSSNAYQTVGNMNNQGNGTNTQTPPSTGGWGLTYIPFMNGAITSNTTIPNFDFLFFNPMSTDTNKALLGHSSFYRTNNTYNYNYFAAYLNDGGSNSFEGITFFPSGGTFDKGYIDVYGMAKS